jgi:hypothetical protein
MREAHQRNAFGASSKLSVQFGIDWAKRLVRRMKQGLPVNGDELKVARAILEAVR